MYKFNSILKVIKTMQRKVTGKLSIPFTAYLMKIPYLNTHAWPEETNTILTIVENDKADQILENLRKPVNVKKEI